MADDLTKTREALTATQGALLHIIDAVKKHGDKASTTAMYRALGEHGGGAVVDERNKLRREAVDLRDSLSDVTAQLTEARDEASEKATQIVTLELRAEEAEAARDALKAATATALEIYRAHWKTEHIRPSLDCVACHMGLTLSAGDPS